MTRPGADLGGRVAIWLLTMAAIVAIAKVGRDRVGGDGSVVVFSPVQRGCAIVVPDAASPQEREAADLLRATLAKAAGLPTAAFPILPERWAPGRAVFVGATARSGDFLGAGAKPPFAVAVGARVRGGAVFLRSERRESIVAAAAWWLQEQLGAQWFVPGPLGEHVPRRASLALQPGEQVARPGFLHRDLGTGGSAEERAWYARNRLEGQFDHGHNFVNIFQPDDLARNPDMAPMRNGQRYLPLGGGDYRWQPNLSSQAAIEHAAAAATRAFDAEPQRLSYSLSVNDTIVFDDSAETLAAVAPPRFFRRRPDYSNLVFRFTNAVAEHVAQRHPNRWLPAYAYYWCENTPDFPVAPNIVPFLTADRSQWAHPEFAAEDRALIERWCRSGAKIVGVYDYFEGSTFMVPRPLLQTVKETIPFHHRAGVRAFYAEGAPNWALDGPKSWLSAQLLWSPERNPDELVDLYFREFWREAERPMREFYALGDRAWRELPGPPEWLRYF